MILISPNNEYPRFKGDVKIAYPTWREGDALPDGWRLVNESAKPEVEAGMTLVENFPTEIDGEYWQNFSVRELTAEELATIEKVRLEWEEEQRQLGLI